MEYYIYLKNTNEYIQETDDDLIWTKTDSINHAFNDSDYERVNNIAQFICKDKHLRMNDDIVIIGEEIVVNTYTYPVGNLKPLYYVDGELHTDLHKLYEKVGKQRIHTLDELAFDDLYYIIEDIDELMSWCMYNGYDLSEVESAFGISIWEDL